MYGPSSARAFDTFYIMYKSLLERSSVARDLYFNLRIPNVHVQCMREAKALRNCIYALFHLVIRVSLLQCVPNSREASKL